MNKPANEWAVNLLAVLILLASILFFIYACK